MHNFTIVPTTEGRMYISWHCTKYLRYSEHNKLAKGVSFSLFYNWENGVRKVHFLTPSSAIRWEDRSFRAVIIQPYTMKELEPFTTWVSELYELSLLHFCTLSPNFCWERLGKYHNSFFSCGSGLKEVKLYIKQMVELWFKWDCTNPVPTLPPNTHSPKNTSSGVQGPRVRLRENYSSGAQKTLKSL